MTPGQPSIGRSIGTVVSMVLLLSACTPIAASTREFLSEPGEGSAVRVELASDGAPNIPASYVAVIRRQGPSTVAWRDDAQKWTCYRANLGQEDTFPVFNEIERLDPVNAERLAERPREPNEGRLALGVYNAKNRCLQIGINQNDEHTTAWGNDVVQKVEWLVVKLTVKANVVDCKSVPIALAEAAKCVEMEAPALAGAIVLHY